MAYILASDRARCRVGQINEIDASPVQMPGFSRLIIMLMGEIRLPLWCVNEAGRKRLVKMAKSQGSNAYLVKIQGYGK